MIRLRVEYKDDEEEFVDESMALPTMIAVLTMLHSKIESRRITRFRILMETNPD